MFAVENIWDNKLGQSSRSMTAIILRVIYGEDGNVDIPVVGRVHLG